MTIEERRAWTFSRCTFKTWFMLAWVQVVSYVSCIYIHLFIFHGYITNSKYDQIPVGLTVQLVKHCTGIAEVMGSNNVEAWTARISFSYLIIHPQFKKYVSYIHIHLFIFHEYITNSQYDQFSLDLIVQLVEYCTGIAEVMGLNLVQPWIFFSGFLFQSQLLKLRTNCEDPSSI